MKCAIKKQQNKQVDDGNDMEILNLRHKPDLKPVRIFVIETNQLSCLDYDLCDQEWIRVSSEDPKDQTQLNQTISFSRTQLKNLREEISEKLLKLSSQQEEIEELGKKKLDALEWISELKLETMKTLCKNEAIKKQLVLEKLRFDKHIDFALNMLQSQL